MNLSDQKHLAPADCNQLQKPLAIYKEPRGVFIPAAYLAHFKDEPMARFVSHVMYKFKRGKNGNRKPLTERNGSYWLKSTWKQFQADTGLSRRQLDRLKKRAIKERIFIIETSGWGPDGASYYRPVCANGADVIDGYPTIEAIMAAAIDAPPSATEDKKLGSYAPPSASICTPECTLMHAQVHPLYKEDEVLEKKPEGKSLGGASLGPTPEPTPDESGNTNPETPTPDPKPETGKPDSKAKQETKGTTPIDTPLAKSQFNKKTNRLTGQYVDELESTYRTHSEGHVSKLADASRGKLRNFGEKLLAAKVVPAIDPQKTLRLILTDAKLFKKWSNAVYYAGGVCRDKPTLDFIGTTSHIDALINVVVAERKLHAEQAAKSASHAAGEGQQVGKANPPSTKPALESLSFPTMEKANAVMAKLTALSKA